MRPLRQAAGIVLAATLYAGTSAWADNGDRPPPLPPANVQIWYAEGQQQHGPFTVAQLKALIRDGKVTPQTLIWRKGMTNWTAARDVDDMAILFVDPNNGPPPPPRDNWGEFMLGTWYYEGQYQQIYTATNATYTADGKFTGSTTFYTDDLLRPGQRVVVGSNAFEGTWKTKPMTGERFELIITYTKATDPNFKISNKPSVNVLQRTGPHSLYNESGKFQARRRQ